MRIKSIEANNFKSLIDFRIELSQFNCLIGLNGSGKSTVLQFIDFVSQLVSGKMKDWLDERKWKSSEIKSKLTKKMNIDLRISFTDMDGREIGHWEASYSPSKNRCTREKFNLSGSLLEVSGGEIHIRPSPDSQEERSQITFDYEGSILSALIEDLLPQAVLDCKKLMKGVKSLDLLSPEYMRQRTRESSGSLGLGGHKLAAFLYELGREGRLNLTKRLKDAYPQLKDMNVKSLQSGWKQLEIIEGYEGKETGLLGFFHQTIAEKLTVMGPGEVFVDTNLTGLTEEIQSLGVEAR